MTSPVMEEQPDREGKDSELISADLSHDEGEPQFAKEDETTSQTLYDDVSDCIKAAEEALDEERKPEEGEDHQDRPPSGENLKTKQDPEAGDLETLLEELDEENTTVISEDGFLPHEDETGPTGEETEDDKHKAVSAPPEEDYEEQLSLLQQLYVEKEQCRTRGTELHLRLLEHFRRRGGVFSEGELLVQEQDYNDYISSFSELQFELTAASEMARQQAEGLKVQTQKRLEQVEEEWCALMALKKDMAAGVGLLGKEDGRARMEAILAVEQGRQDQLVQLRLKHIKLKTRIGKLKSELRAMEDETSDPQLVLDKQETYSLGARRKNEKRQELSQKLQKDMMGTMELLPHVKEKLDWTRRLVDTHRAQLAELEEQMYRQRDVMTRMKQSLHRLHRDNLRLKDQCGLLGHRVLLLDFEDTVDSCRSLEDRLQSLEGVKLLSARKTLRLGR